MLPKFLASKVSQVAILAAAALLVLPACSVNVKKGENGDDKRVDINTPVGGIHVGEGADVRDTGLPVYPGAKLKEKSANDDKNSANVNISTGFFGLKVVAIEYLSDDSPDKLVAFYKDKLKSFGNVLECHTDDKGDPGDVHVNVDDKDPKSHELNCGDNKGSKIELKVGTQENQHIVAIGPQDGGKGTDFGLVYVQIHGGDKDKGTI
ncbi:MAG TPA: hypothetical protein VMT22_02310 [Terriglobales bacterium]|nr:hypothetical protein [Terriglobales bacterium]